MGVFIAVIIILVLVLYSIKDLLAEKDLSSWINMALTSLVLFTVILSIFMILNKGDKPASAAANNKPAAEDSSEAKPMEQKSDEEVMLEIAEEYMLIENDYKKRNPEASDYADVSANYIKQKYKFTDEEWDNFMKHADENKLFDKAKQKISGDSDIDYLIAK